MKEFLLEEHIGAVFNMLVKEKRILPEFPGTDEELKNRDYLDHRKNLKVSEMVVNQMFISYI